MITQSDQDINRIFRRIMYWTGKNGGGTFGYYGAPILLKSGYQVGGAFVAPTLKLTRYHSPHRIRFGEWYKAHVQDDLAGFMLGAWKDDDGAVHIDLTEHVGYQAEAFAMARARGETHIWNWDAMEAVEVPDELDQFAIESLPRSGDPCHCGPGSRALGEHARDCPVFCLYFR